MIVVDAGVWALALASTDADAEAARKILIADDQWVLPSHGAIETLRTVRRLEAAGYLSAEAAAAAVEEICNAEVVTALPEPWLLREVWELRHNVSPYDAAYVALARHLGCPLITLDLRLTRAATWIGVTTMVPGSEG